MERVKFIIKIFTVRKRVKIFIFSEEHIKVYFAGGGGVNIIKLRTNLTPSLPVKVAIMKRVNGYHHIFD